MNEINEAHRFIPGPLLTPDLKPVTRLDSHLIGDSITEFQKFTEKERSRYDSIDF